MTVAAVSKRALAVARPRRVGAASMTSSWTGAAERGSARDAARGHEEVEVVAAELARQQGDGGPHALAACRKHVIQGAGEEREVGLLQGVQRRLDKIGRA